MKDLVKNPIGIIALFISLIYAFANLLLGVTAGTLEETERFPLIGFIVLFPVLVLGVFYRLVSRHHGKLYAPGDYKDDNSFLRTLSEEEKDLKLEHEVEEAIPTNMGAEPAISKEKDDDKRGQSISVSQIREELRLVEDLAIKKFERELGKLARRDVGVGSTGVNFDAFFHEAEKPTFLEIKTLRSPTFGAPILDRVLYNAVVADKYLNSNMKLILVVVYSFERTELPRVEKFWRRRVEACPANIELRFIPRDALDD